MDMTELRLYVAQVEAKSELETKAKALGKTIKALEERLLDEFAKDGTRKVTLDGRTVYLHRQLWASVAADDRPALAAALRNIGVGSLVTEAIAPSTLSAWVRELDRDEGDMPILPPPCTGIVKVTEKFGLRVIKGR